MKCPICDITVRKQPPLLDTGGSVVGFFQVGRKINQLLNAILPTMLEQMIWFDMEGNELTKSYHYILYKEAKHEL